MYIGFVAEQPRVNTTMAMEQIKVFEGVQLIGIYPAGRSKKTFRDSQQATNTFWQTVGLPSNPPVHVQYARNDAHIKDRQNTYRRPHPQTLANPKKLTKELTGEKLGCLGGVWSP
jgi:hypothetical protein